jgi:hypothetical protein
MRHEDTKAKYTPGITPTMENHVRRNPLAPLRPENARRSNPGVARARSLSPAQFPSDPAGNQYLVILPTPDVGTGQTGGVSLLFAAHTAT